MLLILALISSFNFKACERFCHKQGYELCVPIPKDKEAYTCADRIERSGAREMIWTARWATAQEPDPPKAEDPDL